MDCAQPTDCEFFLGAQHGVQIWPILGRCWAHLLSRVGDRPTDTILHAQFHFLIFAKVFKAKYSTKIWLSE